jgi:hypothetical protein
VSHFLGLTIFLVIAAGLVIHAGAELPSFAQWIGTLPGDMIIKKEGLTIYMPLTSSLLISAVLSGVLSVFSRK